jgi:hypothetical protein
MNSSHLHCDAIEFKVKKTLPKASACSGGRASSFLFAREREKERAQKQTLSWINSNSPLQQQKSSGVAWKNRPATDVIEQRQASGVIAPCGCRRKVLIQNDFLSPGTDVPRVRAPLLRGNGDKKMKTQVAPRAENSTRLHGVGENAISLVLAIKVCIRLSPDAEKKASKKIFRPDFCNGAVNVYFLQGADLAKLD